MQDLKAENISLQAKDGKLLLNMLNCKFQQGKVNMVLGPNGSGKTLLLRCLAGFLNPQSGQVKIGNKFLKQIPLHQRAKFLGWLPTYCTIPFSYSVSELVLMGRFPQHQGNIQTSDRLLCRQLLVDLQIESLADRDYNSLSQGEQAKVQLVRVLAAEPQILILDEICANLDIKAKLDILNYLKTLSARGKTIVVSHHDIHSVYNYADYLIMLKEGSLFAQGTPKDCLSPGSIQEVFGIAPKHWQETDQGSLSLVF